MPIIHVPVDERFAIQCFIAHSGAKQCGAVLSRRQPVGLN